MKSLIKKTLSKICAKLGNKRQKLHGEIKFFNRKKRFGFITTDKQDYFFHVGVTQPSDYRDLKEGTKVTFIATIGKKGPQAEEITVLK